MLEEVIHKIFMSRIYIASLKDSEVKITDEQMSVFAAMYRALREIRKRISGATQKRTDLYKIA